MAQIKFDLLSGSGPFTIVIKAGEDSSTDPNRYVSGGIPGIIEYKEIPDGLPHEYTIRVTSPSCEPYQATFTTTNPCKAKPTVNVQQDCNTFKNTGKVFLSVTSTLTDYNQVLLKVFSGSTIITTQIIDTGVAKLIEVPNNTNLKIRVENSFYSNCATEVTYATSCSSAPTCDVSLEIGSVTPDAIVSETPIPTITSVTVLGDQVTIKGTSVCEGKIQVYKRNLNNFTALTARTIPVVNGTWTHSFTGTSGTYSADAFCPAYTRPSQLSFGFASVTAPEEPETPPQETGVINRAGLEYNPGSNTFVGVNTNTDVQAQLVSTGNTTGWLDLNEFGYSSGGQFYNKRLVIGNLPAGNYTIKVRIKGKTEEISVNNIVLANQQVIKNLYDKDAVTPTPTPATFQAVTYITTN